jgi:hypothetical protein
MEKRNRLQNFHVAGKGVREIARETRRDPSNVSRELKRNGTYHAWQGMSLYLHPWKGHVRKRRLSERVAREYAAGGCGTAGRLQPSQNGWAGTVYRAVKNGLFEEGMTARICLRRGEKRRNRHNSRQYSLTRGYI